MTTSTHTGLDTYKRLLQYAKPYLMLFVFGAIGTIVLSLSDAGFAWLVKPIINHGFVKRDRSFCTFSCDSLFCRTNVGVGWRTVCNIKSSVSCAI